MKTFVTQRRQAAKKGINSANLCAFAPLREISGFPLKRRWLVEHSIGDAQGIDRLALILGVGEFAILWLLIWGTKDQSRRQAVPAPVTV